MERFKIKGINEKDVTDFINSFTIRGFNTLRCDETSIEIAYYLDPCDYDLGKTMNNIANVLISKDYDYHRFFGGDGSGYYAVYDCNKKYDSLYERCRFKDILNSSYGYIGNYVSTDTEALKQAFFRINDKSFKMYGGVERATGKFKTTVVWSNGDRETVTATKPVKGYTPVMIFAYALAKKKFRTNSHFKRYVDNHTEKFGEFYVFYDDATYRQATVKKADKKYDIYDMAALSIAIMEYGSLKKLEELVEEAMK